MKRDAWTQAGIFVLLVAIGVVTRVAADRLGSKSIAWYSIVSVCGPALFAGFYLSRRWLAAGVPLLAMFLSDLWLPAYDSTATIVVNYVLFAAPVALGWMLRGRLAPLRFFSAAAGSTLFFYLASNFAHWILMYDVHTGATLLKCYADALLFYKFRFVGDLAWSSALFGAYVLATGRGWLPAVASRPARLEASN